MTKYEKCAKPISIAHYKLFLETKNLDRNKNKAQILQFIAQENFQILQHPKMENKHFIAKYEDQQQKQIALMNNKL